MTKRIGRSNIIGEQGVAYVRRIVLDMGYMFHETGGVEAGIDGLIELRDQETGRVSNVTLQVQVKATERDRLPAETETNFEWPCTEEDVDYWCQGTMPVLLVVVKTKTDHAYWKSIKDYFSSARSVQRPRVVFDKNRDIFDLSAKGYLSTIAANTTPGAVAPPARITESLAPNLIQVLRFGSKLFVADTECKDNQTFGAASRDLVADAPGEWIVKGHRVFSFHDLGCSPWNKICDVGTIEQFDTAEWAFSDDRDQEKDFVQLLSRALNQLTRGELFFDKIEKLYYFKRIPKRDQRIYSYHASTQNTRRSVVKRYSKKKAPKETAYWRHSAFGGHFLRFGENWYLEVTPTYHFTHDGYRKDLFASERLKKIKELENNSAVAGQFMMWSHYLINRAKNDIFSGEYPFLKFGEVDRQVVERGIPDRLWLSQGAPQSVPLFDGSESV